MFFGNKKRIVINKDFRDIESREQQRHLSMHVYGKWRITVNMHMYISQKLRIKYGIEDYINKTVMEEEANGGRSRDGDFSELFRGDGRHQLFNLRARLSIVADR
jgi:hypothetical protein